MSDEQVVNRPGLLRQKELALALGKSTQYLSRMKREGRISYADPERKLYDEQQVRDDLDRTGDVRKIMTAQTQRDARLSMATPMELPVADGEPFEDEPEYTGDAHQDFKIAAAFEKRENARMARLERMEKEGALGLVADMESAAYTEARIIRDTLLGAFPVKLAPALAQLDDAFELEHRLREALRETLQELVRPQLQQEGASGAI